MYLKINWQVNKIVSSLMTFINSSQEHLWGVPETQMRQLEQQILLRWNINVIKLGDLENILIRDILYHQCSSWVFPPHNAVNIKLILPFIIRLISTWVISPASHPLTGWIKWWKGNHRVPSMEHRTPLLRRWCANLSWRHSWIHAISSSVRKYVI